MENICFNFVLIYCKTWIQQKQARKPRSYGFSKIRPTDRVNDLNLKFTQPNFSSRIMQAKNLGAIWFPIVLIEQFFSGPRYTWGPIKCSGGAEPAVQHPVWNSFFWGHYATRWGIRRQFQSADSFSQDVWDPCVQSHLAALPCPQHLGNAHETKSREGSVWQVIERVFIYPSNGLLGAFLLIFAPDQPWV